VIENKRESIKLMRVTTVPQSLEFLLQNQMLFFKSKGLDVSMASANGSSVEKLVVSQGCPHFEIPFTRKITPINDLVALYKVIKLFRKIKPDIVHSHTPKAGLLSMIGAYLAGVKIRMHTVAGLPLMESKGAKKSLLTLMERLTYSFSTNVYPNSYSLLDYIDKNIYSNKEKMKVIGYGSSNGIDLQRFNSENLDSEKLEHIKDKINYDPECFYFISIGRVVKDKGIEEIVTAFREIHSEFPQSRLILLGPYENHLDPLSESSEKEIERNPDIFSVGFSYDVEYYLELSNILVHASYREGFPNVLLQAGAMKTAIVCSKIIGNIDVVDNEKTGLHFEVKNAHDLELKMRKAISDYSLLNEYAENLYQRISEKFERGGIHQNLYENYLDIYNKSICK